MSRLRTTILPTHYRTVCTNVLLTAQAVERWGLVDFFNVCIGDDASTDNAQVVSSAFADIWAATNVLSLPCIFGPNENCRVKFVNKLNYWIIGDDDLVRIRAIPLPTGLLQIQQRDVRYLGNS